MKSSRTHCPRDGAGPGGPPGFTLVELLVVIGIMITLTVITISMVNVTQNEDRVREGAAQVRSFLEGARDRAIHAKEPRGVRFMFNTEGSIDYATSMLYIGSPESFSEGHIQISGLNGDNRTIDLTVTTDLAAQWENLFRRGLIGTGSVLRIINNNVPELYTIVVTDNGQNNVTFRLTKDASATILGLPMEYSLTLAPAVLPNQEPRTFPRDVMIDLTNSHTPASWSSGNLDILFSPHGTVTGLESSAGVINLVVAEGVDVFQGLGPGNSSKQGQERIVTVRTQTGAITVHHVDPTDTDGTPGPDDAFRFAANGEPAK